MAERTPEQIVEKQKSWTAATAQDDQQTFQLAGLDLFCSKLDMLQRAFPDDNFVMGFFCGMFDVAGFQKGINV